MAQFIPPPGPGQAPFQPPTAGPRGLYGPFGMPDTLEAIHFPDADPNKNPSTANPWYWFYPTQQPFAFSFLGGVWGPGWLRLPDFSIIKILAADTQTLTPIPKVGSANLETAIKRGIPDEAFGRIDFRDDRFWGLVTSTDEKNKAGPKAKPKFDVRNGQIVARDSKTNINSIISKAANLFASDWNGDAQAYNQQAAGVNPVAGFRYRGQAGLFSIPLPEGPPTTISQFQQSLNAFIGVPHGPWPNGAYLGSVPGSAFFNINTLTTQAYAFNIRVAQLDPKKYNMSVFPPLDSTIVGNGSSSFNSGNYSGFGNIPFPPAGPIIV